MLTAAARVCCLTELDTVSTIGFSTRSAEKLDGGPLENAITFKTKIASDEGQTMTHKDFERDVAELEATYKKQTSPGIRTVPPEKPVTGDMWFNPTDGGMHVYMGDSKGWVDIKL